MLSKGQRVQTQMGPATIVGFERFDASTGRSLELGTEDTDSNARVCVQLDDAKQWAGGVAGDKPYIRRKELVVL